MRYLVLDIATAPLPDAETYLEGTVKAPSNYRDEAKIAEYIAEKQAERLQMAAVDVDLARVTAVAWQGNDDIGPTVMICQDEAQERAALDVLVRELYRQPHPNVVTFGGFFFDLPLLMRRARYLGVAFPVLSIDRYKSIHVDLCEVLSDRNPQRRRPLSFYVKRLGWADLTKPLSGADEARVHETGQWDALADSLRHDVTATVRLASWLGVIAPVEALV